MIDVGALLQQVEAAAPIDAVEVVAAELGRMVRARAVTLLIADFSGRAVVRLTSAALVEGARSHGVEQAETLPLPGTLYERVLRTQQADVEAIGDGARMVVPVTDRGDAIGLLELDLPRYPSPDEVVDISSAAHALAYVVIAARRHTDVFEWGQRSTPFALAAEIQRRLLPPSYTCEAGQFTLAGWLEPAASVGRRHLRLHARPGPPAGVDHRRRRAPGRGGPGRHPAGRRACATGAGRVSASPTRRGTPTSRWWRTPRPASSSPGSCCRSTCAPARR